VGLYVLDLVSIRDGTGYQKLGHFFDPNQIPGKV